MSTETIAIIGAGWSGLQNALIFLAGGYNVHIFEEQNDVGGTWHPDSAYFGQGTHSPLYTCQFYDFDIPNTRNKFKRVSALDIYNNCRRFCKEKQLYKYISFNTIVKSISYDSKTECSTLEIENSTNGTVKLVDFDFVISTQFNGKRIPKFKGLENFKGDIYHSSDLKEEVFNKIIEDNKKILLLGGSKSATDIAYAFIKRNFKFKWVMRHMYWFLSYDRIYFNNSTGKRPSFLRRFIFFIGTITTSMKFTRQVTYIIWSMLNFIQCPGKKHYNFRKTHYGFLDDNQLDLIRTQCEKIYSEISCLEEQGVVLLDNSKIECDVIVCATGCDPIAKPIKLFRNGQQIVNERLYKYSVLPDMPRLCFTGFCMLGYNLYRVIHHAAWILKYLEENPSTNEMKEMVEHKNKINEQSNPLFDSSDYIVNTIENQVNEMLSDMITKKDLFSMMYDHLVLSKESILLGVRQYLSKKLIPNNKYFNVDL